MPFLPFLESAPANIKPATRESPAAVSPAPTFRASAHDEDVVLDVAAFAKLQLNDLADRLHAVQPRVFRCRGLKRRRGRDSPCAIKGKAKLMIPMAKATGIITPD
jgi:hypothetical protein